MVYIYKKIVSGKTYYYLRASERKGKRIITKDIAYLGNSIEDVKKSLEKLSKYKEEIRKAYRNINLFLESNYYLEKIKSQKLKKDEFIGNKLEEIESCKMHFLKVFSKKDEKTKQETLKNFVIEYTYNTASIEGNTINLEEARNLLQEGLTPKDKTLREIYDLQNSEKVFFEILNSKKELSHEFIINIHDKLIENIDLRKGYRATDIKVIRSNFDATPAPYVKADMDVLLKWYEKNKNSLHPIVLATIFHHKFEKIHPFMDGNGRTGRMLLNYILIKNNYPPLIVHKKTRKEYLESLRNADKSSLTSYKKEDYSNLIQFNAQEFIDTYWNSFL
ncbi:MAG TPA: Fic family protein [Candidatus Nanoarchaeia archaeon]|nr:Fic family protein [Candidatus Nanoarchaeia archaeon]